MLEAFARELRSGEPADLTRAARRAQVVAFLALALPGLPLGGLYLLTRPTPLTLPWAAGLAGMAALLALVVLRLARRAAHGGAQPPSHAALTAAMQGGAAPAVPFLLGCAFLNQPAVLVLLWGVAALALVLAWSSVPRWVRAAIARGS
ncbi:hypothetical protein [Deinococcus apachensis]|uniref:hypothetical protein n=1 Tax=Deinococcus apachensis TaxID=309886 RepID=UPI0003647205|nr:hypothetical protein [Deinococcus apachensis]